MSNFKSILKNHKDNQEPFVEDAPPPSPAPDAVVKPTTSPKTVRNSDKGDEPKRKRGRPSGKRSDSEYNQVTAYIREDTHLAVKRILLNKGETRDFSELVEELLAKWVKSRT